MRGFSDLTGNLQLNKEVMSDDKSWEVTDQWYVLKNSDTDEEGWKYGMSFFTEFTKIKNQLHSVRKRWWMMKCVKWT